MLNSTIAKEDNANIIHLEGELSGATAEEFGKLLMGLADEGRHRIVLDLGALTYASSNGLKPLLEWREKTRHLGGGARLVVCCLQQFVKTVFEVTGLSDIFPAYDSVEAAIHDV